MQKGLRLLFGFTDPVSRRVYAAWGFGLLGIKYLGDLLLSLSASEPLGPIVYLNPILSQRLDSLGSYPEWLPWVMFVWALPFAWIGVSMTTRRAMDAGLPAGVGLLFFFPVINYFVMLGLCLARTSDHARPSLRRLQSVGFNFKVALLSTAAASAFGLVAALVAVFGIQDYGSALFVAVPFIMGVISGTLLNRRGPQSVMQTLGVSVVSVTVAGGLLLLFALEGVMCLAMAAVIAYPLAMIGALLGRALTGSSNPNAQTFGMVLFWPLLAFLPWERSEPYPLRSVTSSIEVDAPPERVWPNVIGFSDLPPPSEWLMKSGVACPLRAHIEGEGVGAIRYCEFTTGPFVEPISAWEPPYRLAFDVSAQPPSMHEWSPYEVVHAPHLVGTMQSERGEFRLTRLPGNRTLLEGTTWYRLKMSPGPYWAFYADRVVHVIHGRVLEHVKNLSLTEPAQTSTSL
ncbi:MAG TPA: SRPBCC family protein [Polyangiaceae bacterium]|jgi:hypothetical protein|nr:SRPBCC family protein [Polyangiaceae bacterium]